MKEVDMTKKIAGASWIKMRTNLWDDPRVSAMCDELDCAEPLVVGGLFYLWSLADEHTVDGIIPSMTLKTLDRKSKIPGFGRAVISVGWLKEVDGGLEVVKFEEHNGASAKRRMEEAKRKAITRSAHAEADSETDSEDKNASEEESPVKTTASEYQDDSVRKLSASCPQKDGQNSDKTEDLSAFCPEKAGQKHDICGHIADLEKEKEKEVEKEVKGLKKTNSPVGGGRPSSDKPKIYFASTMDLSELKLPEGLSEEALREFLVGATTEIDKKGVVTEKPMPYSRVNMLIKQLKDNAETHEPSKVVSQAVANGWRSLVFNDQTKRVKLANPNLSRFIPASVAITSTGPSQSQDDIDAQKAAAIARARQRPEYV